jgi:undecaprenyl-diphosphatase
MKNPGTPAIGYRRYFEPRYMRDLARREFLTLVVLALAAGSVWLFLILANTVRDGQIITWDERILLAMRSPDTHEPVGPAWLEEVARDITALGSMAVQALLAGAVVGYLIIQRRFHTAVVFVIAIGGGIVLASLLKLGFSRPRPDLVSHGMQVFTASFPSGHSMTSAVTYLTLGALLARIHPTAAKKAYIIALAMGIVIAVGLSRIYLGVHWPTDVLAGWTAGAAWAIACWVATRWLQRRGQVEQDNAQAGSLTEAA